MVASIVTMLRREESFWSQRTKTIGETQKQSTQDYGTWRKEKGALQEKIDHDVFPLSFQ